MLGRIKAKFRERKKENELYDTTYARELKKRKSAAIRARATKAAKTRAKDIREGKSGLQELGKNPAVKFAKRIGSNVAHNVAAEGESFSSGGFGYGGGFGYDPAPRRSPRKRTRKKSKRSKTITIRY